MPFIPPFGSAPGASKALDNLASVSINTSLISDTTLTDNLGSSSIFWNNAFVETVQFTSTSKISGSSNQIAAAATIFEIFPFSPAPQVSFLMDSDNTGTSDIHTAEIKLNADAAGSNPAGTLRLATGVLVGGGFGSGGDIILAPGDTDIFRVTSTALGPTTDNAKDLGTGDIRWRDVYPATLRSGLTAADTLLLQARDVDGSVWTTFATLTSADTPTMSLASAVTGTTQSGGDNSTKLATTAYADVAGGGAMATDVLWDVKGDLAVATGADTAIKLAIGTNAQVLTADSGETTGVKWATPVAGGGQTLYGAIVDAAGGGDYTLLSAAITAGETTIFIRNGTYVETADIDITLTNTLIVGENMEKTIIDFDLNRQLDLGGSDSMIREITIKGGNGSGALRLKGGGHKIYHCLFESNSIDILIQASGMSISNCKMKSGVGIRLNFGADNNTIAQCTFADSSISIQVGSDNNIIIGCNIYHSANTVFVAGTGNIFVGNILGNNDASSPGTLSLNGDDNIVISNKFFRGQTATVNAITISSNNNIISGNFIEGTVVAYDDGIALRTTANNNIISNNFISASTAYGVHVEASTETDNVITGNQLIGNTTAPINDLGTGTTIRDNIGTDIISGEKKFIQAKNTSGGQLVQGDLVTWKAVAAGNEITTTTTQGDDLVFGIVDATIADAATGRVQIQGKTTTLKVDGTIDIAIGDFIGTFTTAKIGQKAAAGDMALCIALEAYTTNDSLGVIDALIISPRKI